MKILPLFFIFLFLIGCGTQNVSKQIIAPSPYSSPEKEIDKTFENLEQETPEEPVMENYLPEEQIPTEPSPEYFPEIPEEIIVSQEDIVDEEVLIEDFLQI